MDNSVTTFRSEKHDNSEHETKKQAIFSIGMAF